MYKVFVNDYPIILTDDKKISTNFKTVRYEEISVRDLVEGLFKDELQGICLICSELELCWEKFQKEFKIQKAAGGKVYDNEKKVLFINRFNKWDLPKGKLEKGESIRECAIREVEEECGISGLTIIEELETTYHIFKRKGKTILKITYWFLMHTNYTGSLIPQMEEGIEEVLFKNESEVQFALQNSYENIKLLF